MKLRNYLTILSIMGGLAFGAATVSAHCGTCGAGDKKEHACPADCQKECCKGKEKHAAECKCEGCKDKDSKKCAEGCTKECCQKPEGKKP